MESIRVYTRYELEDSNGETRRTRNERVGCYTPPFEIPVDGIYLWDWFIKINSSVSRSDFNGYYYSIPPSEFLSWSILTGNQIFPEEYEILRAMDEVYCKELNAEIKAKRDREDEKRERELKAKTKKLRRR